MLEIGLILETHEWTIPTITLRILSTGERLERRHITNQVEGLLIHVVVVTFCEASQAGEVDTLGSQHLTQVISGMKTA